MSYEFIYDPTASVPAVLKEQITTSSYKQGMDYYREPDGTLIFRSEERKQTGPPPPGPQSPLVGLRTRVWKFYRFDGLDSTRLLTDGSGAVTDSYAYDAWGNITGHTGTTSQPYQFVGQLGYYTHYQIPSFGLIELGVRFYDPEVGRFTQRDAIHTDTVSEYLYVKNMPTVGMDPSGKIGFLACMASPACRSAVSCLAGAIAMSVVDLLRQLFAGHGINWCHVGGAAICGCLGGTAIGAPGSPTGWLEWLIGKIGIPIVVGGGCLAAVDYFCNPKDPCIPEAPHGKR